MKTIAMMMLAAGMALTVPVAAAAGQGGWLDRVEDRIDRRENYVDRQTNNGRWDVIEDVIDRREDYFDRRGFAGSRAIDRHERRSWRRTWGPQSQ